MKETLFQSLITPDIHWWKEIPLESVPCEHTLNALEVVPDDVKTPPVRERVFNQELMHVTRDVIEKNPSSPTKIEDHKAYQSKTTQQPESSSLELESDHNYSKISETDLDLLLEPEEFSFDQKTFQELYRLSMIDSPVEEDFRPAIETLKKLYRADALAILLYDSVRLACRVMLDTGIDYYTKKNFYLSRGELIVHSQQKIRSIHLQEKEASNLDFRKRLSSTMSKRFAWLEIHSLETCGLQGFVALFFRTDSNRQKAGRKEGGGMIRDLALPLSAFQKSQNEKALPERWKNSTTRHLYLLIKGYLYEKREGPNFAYLLSDSLSTNSAWNLLATRAGRYLADQLPRGDRVVIVAPGVLLILVNHSDQKHIETSVFHLNQSMNSDFQLKFLKYPACGKNIINYIYPAALYMKPCED